MTHDDATPAGVAPAPAAEPSAFVAAGWCVYMLRCADDTLYTGATNDLPARLRTHRRGRGARYTRSRGPLLLVYCEPCDGRSEALKREASLKRLRATGKRALCAWPILPRSPAPER